MTSIPFEPDGSLFDQQKKKKSSLFFFLFDGKSRCEIRFFRFLFVPCFYDFIFFSRSAMGFVLIGSIFDCVICNVL